MKKNHRLTKIIVAGITLTFSTLSLAWNATGHVIIAQIAYNNLTPTAQQDVDYLIEHTDFATTFHNFSSFVYSAPWPDYLNYVVKPPVDGNKDIFNFLRGEAKTWHYVNDPIVVGDIHPKPASVDNAIFAVQYLVPNLSELLEEKNYDLASYDLVFLTHIVGDIHQPLHSAELFDTDFPNGDAGGNLYKIYASFDAKELHAAWDDELGQFDSWKSETTDNGYHPPLEKVQEAATQIQTLCSGEETTDLNPVDWEKESHQIAVNYVYPMNNPNAPKIGDTLSINYISNGQPIVNKQLCLAGKRLANVLNGIFTTPIG